MPRIDFSRYKEELVLYVVNVYQPCTADELLDFVRGSAIEAFKETKKSELDQILKEGEKNGTLLRTKTGQLHLTYSGLRVISEKRLAFPRDKNRLFYLKNLVRRGAGS
jgi:hypothetical protein